MLHPISAFIDENDFFDNCSSSLYWYSDRCDSDEVACTNGDTIAKLPRTRFSETIARGLMQHLATDERYSREGKMYGVLLVQDLLGKQWVLKAFSGLLNGESEVEGWVTPISGRDPTQLEANRMMLEEAHTLSLLEEMKQQLIALQQIPERQQYEVLSQEFETRLQAIAQHHCQRKANRQAQRQRFAQTLIDEALTVSLEMLDQQSRQDGIERRRLKQQRDGILKPLKQKIEQANHQICHLKRQRKTLSQTLQAQMHHAYQLTNFLGETRSLRQLMPNGAPPTGTGECCAPKLLHYAATHKLKPLAMAEFWWGSPSANGDKVQGEFYPACRDRCQPLMGFLLSGLSPQLSDCLAPIQNLGTLPIVYEDDWLFVVDKPSGLLSVPGRHLHTQDSVLSRFQRGSDGAIYAVHRLDQDTSGLLLLARDAVTHRQLSQQFQQRHVHKIYEAVLAQPIEQPHGVIELPLWSDPCDRPRQKVDWQRGKPSVTHFQVIDRKQNGSRLEFVPLTGRTHQLRVHAADERGLGVPILGDRLYGKDTATTRLHLHARSLSFAHPHTRQRIHLQTETPF